MFNLHLVNLNWFYLYIFNLVHGITHLLENLCPSEAVYSYYLSTQAVLGISSCKGNQGCAVLKQCLARPWQLTLPFVNYKKFCLKWQFIRGWKTKVLQAFHKLNKIWESTMAVSMERNLYVAPVISCYLL